MKSFKKLIHSATLSSLVVFMFVTTPAMALSLAVTDDASVGSQSHKSQHTNDGDLFIEDRSRQRQSQENDDEDEFYGNQHKDWKRYKQNRMTYVKFNTSVLNDEISDDDVLKASLRIFINRVKRPGMVHVYRVLGPWDENSLRHEQAPPNETTPLASILVSRADEEHFRYIDITAAVSEWIVNPVTNNGLVLIAEGARIRVDSKENALTSHPMEVELTLASLGEQGIQGPTGPQGIQGLPGNKGEKGDQGLTGTIGPQGAPGIQGPEGPTGETGSQGPAGERGPQGNVGAAGETGPAGVSGPLAGLVCTDGQSAISSNETWVCGSGDPSNGDSLAERFKVDIFPGTPVLKSYWRTVTGGALVIKIEGTRDTGITTSTTVEEVTLRGPPSLDSETSQEGLTRDRFVVTSPVLPNWAALVTQADLGRITIPAIESVAGQNNGFITYRLGVPVLTPIVLRSPIIFEDSEAFVWIDKVAHGILESSTMSVTVLELDGDPALQYNFEQCLPISWVPGNSFETLSIQCERIALDSASVAITEWLQDDSDGHRDVSINILDKTGMELGVTTFQRSLITGYELSVFDAAAVDQLLQETIVFQPESIDTSGTTNPNLGSNLSGTIANPDNVQGQWELLINGAVVNSGPLNPGLVNYNSALVSSQSSYEIRVPLGCSVFRRTGTTSGGTDVTSINITCSSVLAPNLISIQNNVFTPTCAGSGCHNGDVFPPINLSSLEESMNTLICVPSIFSTGLLVEGQNPDFSVLIQKLEGDISGEHPVGSPLPQSNINIIRQWINTLASCP